MKSDYVLETIASTSSAARAVALLTVVSGGTLSLTGCVVAGVSSGGGFFIWPGSIGFLVLILIAVLILRRR
jgi:hypothetical protein